MTHGADVADFNVSTDSYQRAVRRSRNFGPPKPELFARARHGSRAA
jgi:hypothetical protein